MSKYVCLITFVLIWMQPALAQKTAEYTVSISNLQVSSGESVVSFEVDITAGAIRSVVNLPVGWFVAVDNNASWQTSIKANTTVGAAALTPEDFRRLRFVVDKNEFGDLKFKLAGVVSVTKSYEHERLIRLQKSSFSVIIKP